MSVRSIVIIAYASLDTKTKKRKLSEQPAKAGPPAKKAAVSSTYSVKAATVKREVKSSSTAVKDAKSDSSFFSAPKPKPKLPSFRKAPASVKKESDANIAQPSSVDPFQEALKSMGKGRKESPVAVPQVNSMVTASASTSTLTKAGKKKKSVTWAVEGRLEQVKFIEKAIYDDDPADVCVLFIQCIMNSSWFRVLISLFGIWNATRVLHCMRICSRSLLIGQNH